MPAAINISAGAIVVGSGAGGAPVAARLAEAGFDTLLLEAGPRVETREFNGDEGQMTARLWKTGFARDSGLSLYAGACVGGSTVINDALCFRTPAPILERWRREHGLTGLTETEFAPYVERAWQDLHAEETGPDHTSRNATALARGATRLGWKRAPTPRSVKNCANFGLCNLGCPTGAKQSTLVTYVPRAEKAGARVLAETRVESVVIEDGRVSGVRATSAGGEEIEVRAPLVVLAAGVLATPAILQRSGIPAGDGLQCHASVHVSARFREEVHGYYGPTMSHAVHELSDVLGHDGPGVMIENVSAHPVSTAASLPGFGREHAERMAALAHVARALVVMRDRTRGRIEADGSVSYDPSPGDLAILREGMLGAARCYLAAGAEEVWLPVHGTAPLRSERDVEALADVSFSSRRLAHHYAVHLFGGAGMAGSPDTGIVGENGACYGIDGLFVSDASSLPTNTGVNPQITIVANALRIADAIAADRRPS